MNNFINEWFIPIECGLLAVITVWAVKRDIKLLKQRWKDVMRRK